MSQQPELFTPGRRLTQLAQQKPDEVALIVERQDGGADTLTWLQMEQWANRLAHRLAEARVKQASFVAINLPNGRSMWWARWPPISWAPARCRSATACRPRSAIS